MQIIIVLAIVMAAGIFAYMFMKCREQSRDDKAVEVNAPPSEQANVELKKEGNKMENNVKKEKKGTRDLFLETLTAIGCQYEIEDEEEGGNINFAYQGEYFVVRANNEASYIQIFDTHWTHVELYDIDEFARLKKAINESNLKNSVTTVYTIDKAGSTADVHCKSVILFIPEIPNLADYLRIELTDYFRVHETINMEMAKQRATD